MGSALRNFGYINNISEVCRRCKKYERKGGEKGDCFSSDFSGPCQPITYMLIIL